MKPTLTGLDLDGEINHLLWHGTAAMGAPPSFIERSPMYQSLGSAAPLDVAEWVDLVKRIRTGRGSS